MNLLSNLLHKHKDTSIYDKDNLKIIILTDNHFLAPSLHDNGEKYEYIKMTSAGKEMDYQDVALQAMATKIIDLKPDALIITGDLTLNGEYESLHRMKDILSILEDNHIPTYVIPGNHDIYSGWARSFKGNEMLKTKLISPHDFRKVFPDGYKQAYSLDKDSLSYAINLNKDYQLILLDSCIYSKENATKKPIINGVLSKETLHWLEKVLIKAKENNQTSLVFIHHNLYKHNHYFFNGFVLDNATVLKDLLNKYHVPMIFSGHIHIQSIKKEDNGPYEVVTGSFTTNQLSYGVLDLNTKEMSYHKEILSLNDYNKTHHITDEHLLQYPQYMLDISHISSKSLLGRTIDYDKEWSDEYYASIKEFFAKLNDKMYDGHDFNEQEIKEIENSEQYQSIRKRSMLLSKYLYAMLLPKDYSNKKLTIKKDI